MGGDGGYLSPSAGSVRLPESSFDQGVSFMTALELRDWQKRLGLTSERASQYLGIPLGTFLELKKGRQHNAGQSLPGWVWELTYRIEDELNPSRYADVMLAERSKKK